MTKKKNFNYLKLLLILLPFLFTGLISIGLCGKTDTLYIMLWQFLLFICGLAALPLTFTIFKDFKGGSYLLSKPIAILSMSLIVWTLSYLKIPAFSVIGIWIIFLGIACAAYLIKPCRNNFIDKITSDGVLEQIIFEELLFSLVFTLLCFYKGFLPKINGEEKFMDYGFIMSMLRSNVLPANDMWLSGHSINYYYFGQFIYALLTKMSFIPSGYAYNLSMVSSIAVPFVMAYTIGCMLTEAAESFSAYNNKFSRFVTGILAGFTVVIFGNSHSFFYDTESTMGQTILRFLEKNGVTVGDYSTFFYPNSTRFIGHNPDLQKIAESGETIHPGDYTIHEFPFYSYLVGDLHAHVVSMMVVLLIIAISIVMIVKAKQLYASMIDDAIDDPYNIMSFGLSKKLFMAVFSSSITPYLLIVGVLLGIAQMCNYWDFLIYFIFTAMTLLIINTKQHTHFATIPGTIGFIMSMGLILGGYLLTSQHALVHVFVQLLILVCVFLITCIAPCALTSTTLGMSTVFFLAHVVALPFNFNFDMISNTLGKVKYRTSPYQFFILWGTHLIIAITFVIFVIVYKNYRLQVGSGQKAMRSASAGSGIVNVNTENCFTNPIQKFFGERNIVDIFMCGTIFTAILMLIAPEIFYVRDIYTGGYLRSNTMFKFTFAAFIMLSIAIAYAVIRMLWIVNKNHQFSSLTFPFSIVFIILILLIPGHYTGIALRQRCGEITKENYSTLDGTKYLETHASQACSSFEYNNMTEYQAAINWMNNNIEGSPVIMEAYGASYSDNCIVSAYTGLPTVCGWQTHEWLWRFHGIVDEETDTLISDPEQDVWKIYLTPRHNDIDTVYYSENIEDISHILKEYNVKYVVYGDMERVKYGGFDNLATLNSLGTVVFQYDDQSNSSGPIYIYEIK